MFNVLVSNQDIFNNVHRVAGPAHTVEVEPLINSLVDGRFCLSGHWSDKPNVWV
jgi:hypothetical protein